MTLRPACLGDCDALLAWRNDPVTRAMSRNTTIVPIADHEAWLARTLTNPSRRLYVQPGVGVVGFAEGHGEWEVSITVAPERRGRGCAVPLLNAAIAALAADIGAAPRLVAEIRDENEPSRRTFTRSAFRPDGRREGYRRYVRGA